MEDKSRLVYHRGGKIWALRTPSSHDFAHVADVANGLECGCFCEDCGEALVARANIPGETYEKEPHFAHRANTSCDSTGERGLIEVFRQLLEKRSVVELPALTVEPDTILKEPSSVVLEAVKNRDGLSQGDHRIPPHLVLMTEAGKICFHVMVRKSIPDWLVDFYTKTEQPSIVALMEADENGHIYEHDVVDALDTSSCFRWIFNASFEALLSDHLAEVKAQRRAALREAAARWQSEREKTKQAWMAGSRLRKTFNRPPQPPVKHLSVTGSVSTNKSTVTLRCSGCREHECQGPESGDSILCPVCKRHVLHWPK